MRLTREELLRQRQLLEEQLRWIDGKLQNLEQETGERGKLTLRTRQKSAVTPNPTSTPQPKPPAPAPRRIPLFAQEEPAFDLPRPSGGINAMTKLGCFGLALLLALLFLATLFLLPSWIYSNG